MRCKRFQYAFKTNQGASSLILLHLLYRCLFNDFSLSVFLFAKLFPSVFRDVFDPPPPHPRNRFSFCCKCWLNLQMIQWSVSKRFLGTLVSIIFSNCLEHFENMCDLATFREFLDLEKHRCSIWLISEDHCQPITADFFAVILNSLKSYRKLKFALTHLKLMSTLF